MAIMGVALCLLGRKVMRPMLSIQGVVLGGLIGFAMVGRSGDRVLLIAVMVACCVAGLIGAWLLFRVWMGLTFGIALAIVCPMVGLAFQNQPPPTFQPPNLEHLLAAPDHGFDDGFVAMDDAAADRFAPPPLDKGPTKASDATSPDENANPVDDMIQIQAERLRLAVSRLTDETVADGRAWWEQLGSGGQFTLLFGAGAGGLIGLVIGLALPMFTASLLSSLVGGGMIILAVANVDHPQIDRFADSPMAMLGALGLITVVSVFLQWTFFRKKADK